jgi:hypothetical protein
MPMEAIIMVMLGVAVLIVASVRSDLGIFGSSLADEAEAEEKITTT